MATSTVSVQISPAAAKQADGGDHRHTLNGTSNDLTVTIDTSKVTTQSILSTALAAAHRMLAGQLPP
jgi:hypothetical protein